MYNNISLNITSETTMVVWFFMIIFIVKSACLGPQTIYFVGQRLVPAPRIGCVLNFPDFLHNRKNYKWVEGQTTVKQIIINEDAYLTRHSFDRFKLWISVLKQVGNVLFIIRHTVCRSLSKYFAIHIISLADVYKQVKMNSYLGQ